MEISARFDWINLTPEDGHYTFGYYDRCPWDAANRLHLALRIPQQTRLPAGGEPAQVGYIDREERRFYAVTETLAWCHQQGAMTLWLKHQPRTFVYNDFIPEGSAWRPVAQTYNLDSGAGPQYEVPLYTISSDGQWGVTLNFERIPRRGYSYALARLPIEEHVPDLDAEGLSLVDMLTGEVRLIASYRQLIAIHPFPYDLKGAYLWLNHAIFNSDASRVMVLFRHCANPEHPSPWKTHMVTMRLDGSDLRCSLSDAYWRNGAISHQIWGRTPEEILVDADWCGRGHEIVVFDETRHPIQAHLISPGMGPAGHLNFSPDGRWMVADTYPDREGVQRLALVEVSTGRWIELGRFNHRTEGVVRDVRCDLHPRWSADSRMLTVDTIHDGPRKVYLLDVAQAEAEGRLRFPDLEEGQKL